MIHPAIINNTQQDHLFHFTHMIGADLCFFFIVKMFEDLYNIRFQPICIYLRKLILRIVDPGKAIRQTREVLIEQVEIPLFRKLAVHGDRQYGIVDQIFHHFHDVLLQIFTEQDLAALIVDDLSLLVHNVVVLQNVFTDLKVAAFNLFLSVFNGLGKHARSDRFILHAEPLHNALHSFAAEQTHQIVFQRNEELGLARVSLTTGTASQLIVDTTGLMPFGTDDAQTAERSDFFLLRGTLCLIFVQQFLEHFPRVQQFRIVAGHKAGGERNLLVGKFLGFHFLFRFEFRVAAQNDIGTTACHVGRDGDRAQTACFGNDLRFLFMLFRVEDVMLNTAFLEHIAQLLGNLDGDRTHQYRLTGLMHFRDTIDDRVELGRLFGEDRVIQIFSDDRLIGRDHHDVHIVDVAEFVFLGLCRTGHTGQLVVHSEIILQRDRRQRLGLGTDQYALFGFDGLMQAVAVSSAEHQSARKFIDDDDLAVFDDIVDITLHDRLCFERFHDVMVDLHVFRITEVLDLEERFRLGNALIGQTDALFLFFDRIVGVLALIQRVDKLVRDPVKIRRFVALTGNDQRRSRFIDEDRVDLVDDRVVQIPLRQLILVDHHVVAQIIETEFVVGAVCNIRLISRFSGLVGNSVDHAADRQSQECIDLSHPFRVTLCQIVVDRNDMHAFSLECVQISRQSRDQGLAFTGFHFGDPALMQNDAADDLHAEMLHADASPCRFPADRESFRQNVVQGRAVCQTLLEFRCFRFQFFIRQRRHLLFQRHDLIRDLFYFFYFFGIEITKDLFHKTHAKVPFLFISRQIGHDHVDLQRLAAVCLRYFYFKTFVIGFVNKTVPHTREFVKLKHDPAVYGCRVNIFFYIKVVEHLIQIGTAKHAIRTVLLLHNILQLHCIMLVIDLPDQFFDDVFHRHQSRGAAVLIHDDCDMRLTHLQPFEQLRDLHGACHKDDRLDVGGNRHIRSFNEIMKVFLIQHADDAVQIVLVDRQP